MLESVLSGESDPQTQRTIGNVMHSPSSLSRPASNMRLSQSLSRSLTSELSVGSQVLTRPTSSSQRGRAEARSHGSPPRGNPSNRMVEKMQREMENLRVELDEAHAAVQVRESRPQNKLFSHIWPIQVLMLPHADAIRD